MIKEEIESAMISRYTLDVYKKIKNSYIGIAGLGGLGSNAAISLSRIGIGKLLIVDFDKVDISNLNRQYYFLNDVGKNKTQALKQIIKNINPYIEVKTKDIYINKENVCECFKDVDVIIEAFDNPESKAELVNTLLTKMDKPIVSASGVSGYGTSNTIRTRKIMKNLYLIGDLESEVKEKNGLIASRVGIAANHEANMALRIILGETEV